MELVREPGAELAAVPIHTHIPEPGRGLQEELGGLSRRRRADGAPSCLWDSKLFVVSGLSIRPSLELELVVWVPAARARAFPGVCRAGELVGCQEQKEGGAVLHRYSMCR